MIDIRLTDDGNGGDFVLVNNDLQLIEGFQNQVYLGLFGGNLNDDVGEFNESYWANTFIAPENQYTSSFEKAIREIPITTSGIRLMETAAEEDLAFLKKYVELTVSVSILTKDSISLEVFIIAPNNVEEKVRVIWNNTTKQILI